MDMNGMTVIGRPVATVLPTVVTFRTTSTGLMDFPKPAYAHAYLSALERLNTAV